MLVSPFLSSADIFSFTHFALISFRCFPFVQNNEIQQSLGSFNEICGNCFDKGCEKYNLELNVSKTKELVVDFRRRGKSSQPLHINGEVVERVNSFRSVRSTRPVFTGKA